MAANAEVATLELMRDVQLDMTVELGRTHMHLHRIAVVIAFVKDRVLPETGDLFLMLGPVGDMAGEDRAKHLVPADGGIEDRDDAVDLLRRDIETGRNGHLG